MNNALNSIFHLFESTAPPVVYRGRNKIHKNICNKLSVASNEWINRIVSSRDEWNRTHSLQDVAALVALSRSLAKGPSLKKAMFENVKLNVQYVHGKDDESENTTRNKWATPLFGTPAPLFTHIKTEAYRIHTAHTHVSRAATERNNRQIIIMRRTQEINTWTEKCRKSDIDRSVM